MAWVNTEGPEAARARIAEMLQSWTTAGYHLQHYYAMTAEAQLDLYEGDPAAALQRVTDAWRPLKRSFLMVMPSVRLESLHLRARCAAATALGAAASEQGRLQRDALRHARKLEKRRQPWTDGLVSLVRAAVHAQQGRDERAVDTLEEAIAALDQHDLGMYAAVARLRFAALVQGDRGQVEREQAEQHMLEQGVVSPERLLATFAPGFPDK